MINIYPPNILPTPTPSPFYSSARVYVELEGVLMNFTEKAAIALDNLQIPISTTGILVDPNPVYTLTSKEITYDICSGFDFYSNMNKYRWSDILFEEIFRLTRGNIYFVSRQNTWDREAWGGKAQWVWKSFGQAMYDRLIMISDENVVSPTLRLESKDILISSVLTPYILNWCSIGGTGVHWSELDWRSNESIVATELSSRLHLLTTTISEVG